MRTLKAFGRFWYDFIVGDDWKIAVSVVCALAVLCALMTGAGLGDTALAVLGAALIVGAFIVSLVVDTRRGK